MGNGPVQALLEIIAVIVLWGASMVMAEFGIEADFARRAVPAEQASPPAAEAPRKTPAACAGHAVRRTRIHEI